jgi:hypothetical protein
MLGGFSFRRESADSKDAGPAFRPHRLLCDWDKGDGMRISDAASGVAVFGATGSGKTSGIDQQLAKAYLRAGFGGIALCAKAGEARQWQAWAEQTGRSADLVIVEPGGDARFNWMDYEANRLEREPVSPSTSSRCSTNLAASPPAIRVRRKAATARSHALFSKSLRTGRPCSRPTS